MLSPSSISQRRWYQFSIRTLMAVVTLAAIISGVVWGLWPWWQERNAVFHSREKILAAQTSAEASDAYRALLSPGREERMHRLAEDADTSIALKAAFEIRAERSGDRATLQPDKQRAFLRIFEQKTSLTPPEWWTNELQMEPPSHDGTPFQYAERVIEAKGIFVSLGDRQLCLTRDQYQAIDHSGVMYRKHIPVIIGTSHSYLACFDDYGGWGFKLYCLDSATGSTVWEAKVWAMGDYSGRIVSSDHDAQIELNENRIIVWGTSQRGAYVEAFEAATGRNQLRFCSEYWYTR